MPSKVGRVSWPAPAKMAKTMNSTLTNRRPWWQCCIRPWAKIISAGAWAHFWMRTNSKRPSPLTCGTFARKRWTTRRTFAKWWIYGRRWRVSRCWRWQRLARPSQFRRRNSTQWISMRFKMIRICWISRRPRRRAHQQRRHRTATKRNQQPNGCFRSNMWRTLWTLATHCGSTIPMVIIQFAFTWMAFIQFAFRWFQWRSPFRSAWNGSRSIPGKMVTIVCCTMKIIGATLWKSWKWIMKPFRQR